MAVNKIIQISAVGHENTRNTQSNGSLFALDSDGNIYVMAIETHSWRSVKPPITSSNSDYEAALYKILDDLYYEGESTDAKIWQGVEEIQRLNSLHFT
jgi:hypothetical protein